MKTDRLISAVKKYTVHSSDNGSVITDSSRRDLIYTAMTRSPYGIISEQPLSLIYIHSNFDRTRPFILISCHIDSVYNNYFTENMNNKIRGNFDNSACNAVLVEAAVMDELRPQAVIVFTGDEERNSAGAVQTVKALKAESLFETLGSVVTLDLTYEYFKKASFTVENVFRGKKEPLEGCIPHFKTNSDFICLIKKHLYFGSKSAGIIRKGDPDESYIYKKFGCSTFSYCLPCFASDGDMHSENGVEIRKKDLLKYYDNLIFMVNGMCKTFLSWKMPEE